MVITKNYWCPLKKCANVISQLLSNTYIRMLIIGLVIPKTRLNLRYGMGSSVKSVVRNLLTYCRGTDSVQTGSLDTFLSRFALSYGMTGWVV